MFMSHFEERTVINNINVTDKVMLILFSVKFIVMGGLYMSRRGENIYNSKSTVVGVL